VVAVKCLAFRYRKCLLTSVEKGVYPSYTYGRFLKQTEEAEVV
jgi:hypothetical protein